MWRAHHSGHGTRNACTYTFARGNSSSLSRHPPLLMAIDLDAARTALRRLPVAPYRAWRLARPEAATIREADNDIQNGWVREADRELIELTAPYPWEAGGAPAVSVNEMHSWRMLDALLLAHSATGSWAYLEIAVELAEDWADHGAQAGGAWRAPAPANRAHHLAYLVHAAAVEDGLDMSRWRKLARLAERHAHRLLKEVDPSIPGLLAALGRRSLVTRLGTELDVGPSPDVVAALDSVTDDRGTVRSGATVDHIDVATALAALDTDDGLDLTDRRRRIEDGLAWLITTDGQPANFGATALEPVNGLWRGGDVAVQELVAPLASELLSCALSAAEAGTPPTSDTRLLHGADLMVAKPVWNTFGDPGSYVAVDRRTGTLVWHDAGRGLIVAPGTTPEALEGGASERLSRGRDWLQSARPNALLVEPPPSGAAEVTGRVGVVNGTTFFDVASEQGSSRRSVVLDPGRWLFVADWASHDDQLTAEQSFLLGPGLDAIDHDGGYLVSAEGRPIFWAMPIHGAPASTGVRRGGETGAAGGWWAPRPGRIAPASQIGWVVEGAHVLLATVFSLVGPARAVPTGAWSFAFDVEGTTTRLSLGPLGLVDVQEAT